MVEKRRRARWALKNELALLADAFGGTGGARLYAATLFKRIHKTTEAAATAKQVWAVIFTLRNRARAKERSSNRPRICTNLHE